MTSDHRDVSDQELVIRSISRDKESYGDLYLRYQKEIFRYIYYRVAETFEAEDLTEEVFIKAWEALPRMQAEGMNFRAWLYRIAHNIVIDRHRTHRDSVSLNQAVKLSGLNDQPEEAFQQNALANDIARTIARLEPDFQDVILYRFILGFSHAETAEIMGMSIVYIRVLQYRALKKMKEILNKESAGYD